MATLKVVMATCYRAAVTSYRYVPRAKSDVAITSGPRTIETSKVKLFDRINYKKHPKRIFQCLVVSTVYLLLSALCRRHSIS